MSQPDNLVEATITDLAKALASGSLTSVDLVAKYLLRISAYDCRNISLNSIPLINDEVFEEAAAADDRRQNGKAISLLDGIPFTVKDSYKVKKMTAASGSQAFEDLIASEDAFTVASLRHAGAVLLGKTNMCPMAYGGMLRGLYGRAESPYNLEYLPAAFGSGSSNGSAVSVAASFAAFGMGEETVSSGRSPASNNALVAYTPSRGIISIRGNWPLYPTCDVVVPHTRTVDDLLILLDTITGEDDRTTGDFWRDQPFIQLPKLTNKPKSFTEIKDTSYLTGKRIAIPRIFVEQVENGPYVSKQTSTLAKQAIADLQAVGATVDVIESLPVFQAYENPGSNSSAKPRLPENWNATERGTLIAHAWEDFLQANSDPQFPSLTKIDPRQIFPHLQPDNVQVKFTEPANAIKWSKLADYIRDRPDPSKSRSNIYDIPQLDIAVQALEDMRKVYFENWMDEHSYDYVVFPAAGDVAGSDADIDEDAARHAWTDGVKYSHGNRALRHLGIPSVTVPIGTLDTKSMPMGLTLIGRAYDDVHLLQAGYALEQKTKRRLAPILTPALPSDAINNMQEQCQSSISTARPELSLQVVTASFRHDGLVDIVVEGDIGSLSTSNEQHGKICLDVYIDGTRLPDTDVQVASDQITQDVKGKTLFSVRHTTKPPPQRNLRNQVAGKVARDSIMIMILARNGREGLSAGALRLIHVSQIRGLELSNTQS